MSLIKVITWSAIIMFFVVLILFFFGCGAVKPPGPPVPADAGTADECVYACNNLARLECPGWRGSPGEDEVFDTDDDVSCQEVCYVIVSGEPTATLHQRCVAAATSCYGVDKCFDVEP